MLNKISFDELFKDKDLALPVDKRVNIELFLDVVNSNPNGDPDSENLPRQDLLGYGYMTDVCLKRKVRDFVEENYFNENEDYKRGETGYEIYIKNSRLLNDKNDDAYEAFSDEIKELGKKDKANKLDKKKPSPAIVKLLQEYMCGRYYDIRTFGAVMSTEISCGTVRGPVQVSFASSQDVIDPQIITITRVALAGKADEGKNNTMGNKAIVPYGLYRYHIYVNPNLAEKTGFSWGDLKVLIQSLVFGFERDRSAARGQINPARIYVFEHSSNMGDCLSKCIENSIVAKASSDMPHSLDDYDFIDNTESLPQNLRVYEINLY